jgi:4-hydroxybutyryl-CoA dehydratase/vinylacetyl-CoA-Delta-isomerase
MMTPGEYQESLKDLHIKALIGGKIITNPLAHPVVHPVLNGMIKSYAMAHMPQYEEIVTATSHLTGGRINRFNHVHQNIDDLYKKDTLNDLFASDNGKLFPRTRAMDALNALSITTYDIEEKYGTGFHARFCNYITYIQDNDLICDGSMVDPEPTKYSSISYSRYADLFVHFVEE